MEHVSDAELPDEVPEPGYTNYLLYCDESGIDGQRYYGFGSLWMPWERRPEFCELIRELREEYGYWHEIKWNKIARANSSFYCALVQLFFQQRWLAFHALVVRRGYTDMSFHASYDQEKRKRFVMLVEKKISRFASDGKGKKAYHVRVDPLPSSYKKADEAAMKIAANALRRDLGQTPLKTLITRNSRDAPGIQLSDLLLGAVMSVWQDSASSEPKLKVRESVAAHLGWPDLRADTRPHEKKFNIWYFYARDDKRPREVKTRELKLKYPMPHLKKTWSAHLPTDR